MNTEDLEELSHEQLIRLIDRQEAEIIKIRKKLYYKNFRQMIYSTVALFVTLIATITMVFTFLLPILHIYGESMAPTFEEGDIAFTIKTDNIARGDIIAFYYNNEIWIKRVIATSGDRVDIDEEGNVYVNGELLQEPYLAEKTKGECNIDLPYQVPDNQLFVLGDARKISLDSRNAAIGCIPEKRVVGKILFKIF